MQDDYAILVFYSAEDEGCIADIPDLNYCSAFGETPEEALSEAPVAKEVWLESARADGIPLPEPTYRARYLTERFGESRIEG